MVNAPDDQGTLEDAIAFASRAHAGQVYRGFYGRADEPYILHPLRVMASVPPDCRIVAVLHDCLEDAGCLPDWLSQDHAAALQLLTRNKESVSYTDYVAALLQAKGTSGRIARRVKVADLKDNLAHDPPPGLEGRYLAALDILLDEDAPESGEAS